MRRNTVIMITLYVKTGCPFCAKVLKKAEELGISYEEKNIADPAVADELIARGGKRQVPYLVDGETEMYESDAIITYLETKNGGGKPAGIRLHRDDDADVCEACQ